jgi:hypothetical protein
VPEYDFTDAPRPVDPVELLASHHKALIEAGRTLDVLSLRTGGLHPVLQKMAQDHAQAQADQNRMGHQGWDERSKSLFTLIPEATNFREVCAYSGYRFPEVTKNLFESWWKSKAHWTWVDGRCDFWGYAMAYDSKSRLFFACGIFADRRANQTAASAGTAPSTRNQSP